jgi:formylglycine-generating enzyme required for sulfatase activity
MKKNFKAPFFMLIACACIFSCGEYEYSTSDSDETGSLGFQVEWRGAPTLKEGRTSARALDCVASNIETVTFEIVDINDNLLATDSWSCSIGQGIVYGVPAGTDRKLIVEGKDIQERVLYRGIVEGIVVVAGGHEDVATVVCDPTAIIDFAFLQYRSYEDSASIYRGWIDFLKDGHPIDMSDITQISLKNESGSSIYLSGTNFFSTSQFNGVWNDTTSSVDYSGPSYYAGFSIGFDSETSLPAGNYTYEAMTSQDYLVSTTLYFPGETILPTVDDASMNYEWLVDDSLHLTWVTPVGTFNQLRLVLLDQDFGDLLYVKLPTNANELTIPGDMIQDMTYFKNPNDVYWTIQTRSYTATSDKNNYARGYSNFVTIPWQPVPLNNLGMSFIKVPSGTFTMGSPDGVSEYPIGSGETPSAEAGRGTDETPHQVILTQSYYMQTTEVTQGQWQAVMGSNPSDFSICGDDCPVEQVSWNDIQTFLSTLNSMGQGTYRLPTEAEWEYAARSGSATAIASGDIGFTNCSDDANLDKMGWYCYNSGDETHPVAQKQPNAWGLYDMHGNVSELCEDWYGDYPTGPVTNPTGAIGGTRKVHRGGAWGSWVATCRSAHRYSWLPHESSQGTGFRLVREP